MWIDIFPNLGPDHWTGGWLLDEKCGAGNFYDFVNKHNDPNKVTNDDLRELFMKYISEEMGLEAMIVESNTSLLHDKKTILVNFPEKDVVYYSLKY